MYSRKRLGLQNTPPLETQLFVSLKAVLDIRLSPSTVEQAEAITRARHVIREIEGMTNADTI